MIAAGEIPAMTLVCPSDGLHGEGSGYLPLANGNFERWIEQVPEIVGTVISSYSQNSPVFLCGLSMGGYGALRLGSKFADKYAAISAHSSITSPDQFRHFLNEEEADHFLATETPEWSLLYWIERHREKLPPLRFDCGLEDELCSENDRFHDSLLERGVPHLYERLEGAHDWDYWRRNLRRTLLFFGAIARQWTSD
jgi:S-formylglutathione hydrolase FrmB